MSALDELRFGSQRTLNLRETLPTAAEAVRRTDAWLREHQVKGSKEVLIVTGRGSQSVGGVPVLRSAIEKLLFELRRRGVVRSHREHNPGAFVAVLAPLRHLVEAIPRRRDQVRPRNNVALHGVSADTIGLLRDLAERSLDALGVQHDETRIEDEMHRQLAAIAPALSSTSQPDDALRAALRAAIAEYD